MLLNEYFRYLYQQEFIARNPMANVEMLKRANFMSAQGKENLPPTETITVFSEEEVEAMFLIESFEGLTDLLKNEITFRKAKYSESQLNIYLIAIINEHGNVIFQKEIAHGIEKVTKVFVDSRNRIAHIKKKSDKKFLSGEESLIYAIKLFYLYRVVLLHLLEIDSSLYERKIKEAVNTWDSHQGIVDRFLEITL